MKTYSTNRIEVIDILRGFALFGILVVHFCGEFAGWSSLYKNPVPTAPLPTAQVDSAVNFVLFFLLVNRSRTLFSFLFGIGFFYQLDKARRKGISIEKSFTRRMIVLFLIGLFHAYLLWSGDVLRIYAVCGLGLLLVYKWTPRYLFIAAITCTILIPFVGIVIHSLSHYQGLINEQDMIEMYNGYSGSDYLGLMNANLLRDMAINWDPFAIAGYFFPVLGNFIFGYWAGKVKLFNKLTENRAFLYRCLIISSIIGVVFSSSLVRVFEKVSGTNASSVLPTYILNILDFFYNFSIEAIAFFVLCFIVFLYDFPFLKNKLSLVSYAGRMTLTNYIMQSVFAVVFFFGVGFGFIGQFGAFQVLFISVAFFAFQVWYSRLWLQYFTLGPVEFIWRSMVEGKWLNIKREVETFRQPTMGQA